MNRDGFVTPTNIVWNKVHERFQVQWDMCCARPQISSIALTAQLHKQFALEKEVISMMPCSITTSLCALKQHFNL